MANTENVKYIIYKKVVYIIKLGPVYVWETAASSRNNCIQLAFRHFNVKSTKTLRDKGAEVVIIHTNEIKEVN
jgi:competence transcription factor ComK